MKRLAIVFGKVLLSVAIGVTIELLGKFVIFYECEIMRRVKCRGMSFIYGIPRIDADLLLSALFGLSLCFGAGWLLDKLVNRLMRQEIFQRIVIIAALLVTGAFFECADDCSANPGGF